MRCKSLALIRSHSSSSAYSPRGGLNGSRARKRRRTRWRALHERIVESIGSGVVTTDIEGRIYTVNRAGEEITGYRAAHLRGQEASILFGDLAERIESSMGAVRDGKPLPRFEADCLTPDGLRIRLGFSIAQLASERSEPTGLVITFQDLTEVRALEETSRRQDRLAAVGRVSAGIAHEIRNPLNYINLTLDHLRAKFAPEENGKRGDFEKLTAQLKEEVGRINNQITDFLNYSRPAKPNLQPLEGLEVIEDSLRIIEAQAEEQNIKISLVARENVPRLLGDTELLRSVFNNLLINAVQAMQATGGNLDITISPDENFVKIEIADTGAGIPEENLTKIFEPYFSTKDTGTGLGLAIVKKNIDVHNGAIEAESKLGEGTKFTVRLPRV